MPFENLYFYDDSIISTEPFQEGNLIHSSGQEKSPGGGSTRGSLVCTWMSRSIRAQPCIYQIEGLDKS